MKPIAYETWVKLHHWIDTGGDVASPIAAWLFYEIPILGPLIGEGLIKILGWALKDILDYLPHENEPQPKEFALGKLRSPGFKYYVASPNMYGGDAERARAASLEAQVKQPVSYGDPEEVAKAEALIAKYKKESGVKDITHLTPKELKKVDEYNESIKPLEPAWAKLEEDGSDEEPVWGKYFKGALKPTKVGIAHIKGPNYYDPKALGIINKKEANPTWGRAGF